MPNSSSGGSGRSHRAAHRHTGLPEAVLRPDDELRVNQDCSLRRQAEEVIAVNPRDADNLIAGQNDSRVGFNHCGYDYSLDGGRTWGD